MIDENTTMTNKSDNTLSEAEYLRQEYSKIDAWVAPKVKRDKGLELTCTISKNLQHFMDTSHAPQPLSYFEEKIKSIRADASRANKIKPLTVEDIKEICPLSMRNTL